MSDLIRNPSDDVLLWGLNVLLQVSLVAAIALAVGRTLRRSAAARYLLLCSALMLVLLCPLLTAVVQSTGMGLVSVSVVQHELASTIEPVAAAAAPVVEGGAPEVTAKSSDAFDPGKSAATDLYQGWSQSDASEVPQFIEGDTTAIEGDPEARIPAIGTTSASSDDPTSASTGWGSALRMFGRWVLFVWIVGTLTLLTRLAVAWYRLSKLLRDAIPGTDRRLAECVREVWPALAGTRDRRVPQLVFSDRVSGPVAAGIVWPKVVLPESFAGKISSLQLREILIHEVAHIARGDQIVVLLQNITAAVFWIHPLVRMLNGALAQAREEVCDNHVLAATDATSYSRTLLTLAQVLRSSPAVPGTVGLFTSRWRLEERVAGLLDEQRNRVTRISKTASSLIAIAAIALGMTAAIGTISTAGRLPDGGSDHPAVESATTAGAARSDDTVAVSGIVLKPDGSPAAGAIIRTAAQTPADLKHLLGDDFETPMSVTAADGEGRFQIAVHTNPFGDVDLAGTRYDGRWKETQIAASLEGYGCDWVVYSEIKIAEPVTLRLVEDMPIRGRIVDLEGRPASGVIVKIADIRASETGDLSAWLDAVAAGENPQTAHRHASRYTQLRVAGIADTRTTDAEGDFEIRGLGRERLTGLEFVGQNLAFQSARAVTRDMETATMSIFGDATEQVYGASFVLSMSPSQSVEGVVVDAETKAPLSGVRVEGDRFAGSNLGGRQSLVTTTDEQGRFRIFGIPKAQPNAQRGRRHNYLMLRPGDDQPYLMRQVQVPVGEGLDPIAMTVELHRGIWIQGRVTDKVTGEPIPAVRMHYLAYRTNEFARALPEFDDDGNVDGDQTRYQTDMEGNYRLVGLPGPAVIGAESIPKPYRYGVGYDALAIPEEPGAAFGMFYRNPINPSPKWPNTVAVIDPAADAESIELNLELDPGATVDIRVVDHQDALVTGALLRGLTSRFGAPEVTEARTYQAVNLTPDESRPIIVHHEGRNLGRIARIKSAHIEKGTMQILLQQCVRVTGTLTDEGKPLSGIRIEPRILPSGDFGASLPVLVTDHQGRFEGTLLPGTRYMLFAEGKGLDLFAVVAEEVKIEPGKSIDLGTLTLTEDRKFASYEPSVPVADPQDAEAAPDDPSPPSQPVAEDDQRPLTVGGAVSDESGQPIVGAVVVAVGLKFVHGQSPTASVLAEEVTDAAGRFHLSIGGAMASTHRYPSVIALADGKGIAFQRLHLDQQDSATVALQMKSETLIRVRLIDIEGQPAANLPVELTAIMASQMQGVGLQDVVVKNRDGFGKLRTDDAGMLAIEGIASGHGVMLRIAGNEAFAPQEIALNTGLPEQRGEHDATYRPLAMNIEQGEVGTLALAPARFFEGVVLLGDSRKPAAGATVSVASSQQLAGGSMMSVQGTTDQVGRFRINALPGVRFRITAYPPTGSAFQIRTLEDLRWDAGEPTRTIEIKLAQGLVAHGTVVDAVTNQPLNGAYVQYAPDQLHNENITPGVITGWQGIQQTNARGGFRISVFPGPGTLLIHAPDKGSYVLQASTRRELEGQRGGQRMYAHAFHSIDPVVGQPMEAITIRLTPGKTVVPRVVGPSGDPAEDAVVVSRLRIAPTSPYWRAFAGSELNERWKVPGIEEGKQYETYFLDPKSRTGATVQLTADDLQPTVTLVPCGSAKATLVDQNGDPLAHSGNHSLYMVVTPGPSRFDVPAMRRGEIVADEDFAVNVDRLNHDELKTDANGEIVFPALIPSATYRFHNRVNGRWRIEKEFKAESGKTYDMGRIVIQVTEE